MHPVHGEVEVGNCQAALTDVSRDDRRQSVAIGGRTGFRSLCRYQAPFGSRVEPCTAQAESMLPRRQARAPSTAVPLLGPTANLLQPTNRARRPRTAPIRRLIATASPFRRNRSPRSSRDPNAALASGQRERSRRAGTVESRSPTVTESPASTRRAGTASLRSKRVGSNGSQSVPNPVYRIAEVPQSQREIARNWGTWQTH